MRETIEAFSKYLQRQEKSKNTVEKYVRDVRKFFSFLGRDEINRDSVLRYKEELQREYKPSSANSMLVALNAYLRFIENQIRENFGFEGTPIKLIVREKGEKKQ